MNSSFVLGPSSFHRGYTLVELLVVITIAVILIAAALPIAKRMMDDSRSRDAARLEGAVRATGSGHRIFGADAQALDDLSVRLRGALGDAAYEAARDEGARLDDDAAVEHALRSLRSLQSGDRG